MNYPTASRRAIKKIFLNLFSLILFFFEFFVTLFKLIASNEVTNKLSIFKLNKMGEEVFIPISFFASLVLILYLFFSTRNKERLALIEKGADASLFKTKSRSFPTLKLGMFIAGIGLGILFGNIIAVSTSLEEETAYFSMIFLFAGSSLIANHLLEKKSIKNSDE